LNEIFQRVGGRGCLSYCGKSGGIGGSELTSKNGKSGEEAGSLVRAA